MSEIEVFVAAFFGGLAGGLIVSWRTWRDVVIEIRDHGWRNDR